VLHPQQGDETNIPKKESIMSKHIAVVCGDAAQQALFSDLAGIRTAFAADLDSIPKDTDCVVLSQEQAGAQLAAQIEKLHGLLYTVAVLSADRTEGNQDVLADCGADDILFLPMSKKLLARRLTQIAESRLHGDTAVDFAAFDRIGEANQGRGAFIVQEHDFTNIYRFVARILERLEKQAQMVIFNFDNPFGVIGATEDVHNFSKIVRACLRRGDISAASGTKVLLILLGASAEDAQGVVKRLTDTFASHYYDAESKITYEMREIAAEK